MLSVLLHSALNRRGTTLFGGHCLQWLSLMSCPFALGVCSRLERFVGGAGGLLSIRIQPLFRCIKKLSGSCETDLYVLVCHLDLGVIVALEA